MTNSIQDLRIKMIRETEEFLGRNLAAGQAAPIAAPLPGHSYNLDPWKTLLAIFRGQNVVSAGRSAKAVEFPVGMPLGIAACRPHDDGPAGSRAA